MTLLYDRIRIVAASHQAAKDYAESLGYSPYGWLFLFSPQQVQYIPRGGRVVIVEPWAAHPEHDSIAAAIQERGLHRVVAREAPEGAWNRSGYVHRYYPHESATETPRDPQGEDSKNGETT